jgi:hypothetical protein
MRPLRSLLVFVAVVFLGGALLAPWLYWLAETLSHVIPSLSERPFHRFVNRAILGLALIGLWPFLRSLGVRSLRDVGLVGPSGHGRKLAGGFAIGFLSLACAAALALLFGARKANADLSALDLALKVTGIVLTAAVVAVLEEVLFRGALFGALRKVWHWVFALALSSMVYAIVHFMESARLAGPVRWTSGLELLPLMLRGFVNVHEIIPGFFNLTLAGAILSVAYQRTGNLYLSLGLHAGWIFWLKSYNTLTTEVVGERTWFWGGGKLIDGWLVLPLLALVLFAVLRALRPDEHASRYARLVT